MVTGYRGEGRAGILFSSAGVSVEGILAIDNFWGIIAEGAGSTVKGNVAVDNFNGILVTNGAVHGNIAVRNEQFGIILANSSAIENAAMDNSVGIDVGCPSNLIGNTAINNRSNGIRVRGSGCNANENLNR
jgi:hypothetical protein